MNLQWKSKGASPYMFYVELVDMEEPYVWASIYNNKDGYWANCFTKERDKVEGLGKFDNFQDAEQAIERWMINEKIIETP